MLRQNCYILISISIEETISRTNWFYNCVKWIDREIYGKGSQKRWSSPAGSSAGPARLARSWTAKPVTPDAANYHRRRRRRRLFRRSWSAPFRENYPAASNASTSRPWIYHPADAISPLHSSLGRVLIFQGGRARSRFKIQKSKQKLMPPVQTRAT